MIKDSENLREARHHFLLSQKEFLLSVLYLCRYIKEFFQTNGRSSSPIYYAADALEMLINSLLIMIPFDENGGKEFREDLRVLINAIKNIEREYERSGMSFQQGSIEYRMMELLKRVAEMLEEGQGGFSSRQRKKNRKKVKIS